MLRKKIILLLINFYWVPFCQTSHTSKLKYPDFQLKKGVYIKNIKELQEIANKKKSLKIILLDLHDVILFKDIPGLFYQGFNLVKRPKAFIATLKFLKMYVMRNSGETKETILKKFISQSPKQKKYIHHYHKIVNSYSIDPLMLNLLKKLRQQGVIILIASNIGDQSLEFAHEYGYFSELFDIVHGFVASHYDEEKKISIAKPKKEFFEYIVHQVIPLFYTGPLRNNILLIDDKAENCRRAIESRLLAFLYDKNVGQLEEVLHYYGFLGNNPAGYLTLRSNRRLSTTIKNTQTRVFVKTKSGIQIARKKINRRNKKSNH